MRRSLYVLALTAAVKACTWGALLSCTGADQLSPPSVEIGDN